MRRWGRWLPLVLTLIVGAISVVSLRGPSATSDSLVAATATSTNQATTVPSSVVPSSTTTSTTPTIPDPVVPLNPVQEPAFDPYGGIATVGVLGPAETLNPFVERSGLGDAVGAMTWASAFVVDGATYDLAPGILSELPSYANGGLVDNDDGSVTVSLQIHHDARWQDGTAITGFDLAFTAEAIASDARLDRALRDLYRLIEEPEPTDSAFRFRLADPTIDYFSMFEVVLPRHQVEGTDLSRDWNELPWLSSGPFIIGSITEDGIVHLERNSQYWRLASDGNSLPFLDGVALVPYSSPTDVAVALREKQLSVGDLATEYQLVEERDDIDIVIAQGEELEQVGFQFGEGRFAANPRSLVESKTLRELVAALVGDDALVSEIGGSSLYASDSVVGAQWPRAAADVGSEDESEDGVGDQAELDRVAEELERDFDELPPTIAYLTTTSFERAQMAGIVLRDLAARGIGVEAELQEPGLFFNDSVIPGEFEIAQWAWTVTPGPVGAAHDIQSWFGSEPNRGGLDFYRWSANTESTELVEQIASLDAIMDLEELRAALASIDAQLIDMVVAVPLWQTSIGAGIDGARLSGYVHPRFGLAITHNAAEWRVPGGCANVPDGAVCGGVILPSSAR